MNNIITLANRPTGRPTTDDFGFSSEENPEAGDDEILLASKYISVDPYMRGRMRDADSYVEPYKLDEPINSVIVAEVLESHNNQFTKGDYVLGELEWKEQQVSNGKGLTKVDSNAAPLSAYLGVLGVTGLTAYIGLKEIGKPKDGETMVVSGAAGAVGSVAGQIGKIHGCRVVGIAGSDEKVELLQSKFGFDDGINYKKTDDMAGAIAATCPEGVDVYFDNVGGEITDGVLANINTFARVVACGAIALYNATSQPMGPRVETTLITKSALMQGFIISNYRDEFEAGIKQLATWLNEGKLDHSETIVEGFEQLPNAFIGLFDGKNKGKMVVKV